MGWVVNATPRCFTPGKETRYPSYRWLGEPQGRSGRVRKILIPPGFGSPYRPACSKSLYRLHYPGPLYTHTHTHTHTHIYIYIYIYIYIHTYIHINICHAFVGLDNKLYTMHSTYIKTQKIEFTLYSKMGNTMECSRSVWTRSGNIADTIRRCAVQPTCPLPTANAAMFHTCSITA